MGLLGKKKKDEAGDETNAQNNEVTSLDFDENSSENLGQFSDNSNELLSDVLSDELLSDDAEEEEEAENDGKPGNKANDDDGLESGLLDIFAEEESQDSDMAALAKYLEEVDTESLLVQARNVLMRLRSVRG